jgi:VanZ family protein
MENACAETVPGSPAHMLRYWLPVVAYTTLIFYLSSLPHPEDKLPNFLFEQLGDKLLHAVEYAVLAFLCYRAFRHAAGPRAASKALILAIGAASLYGMTDEVHQAFVPLRESSWSDWIADTAGAVAGAVGRRCFQKGGTKHGIS